MTDDGDAPKENKERKYAKGENRRKHVGSEPYARMVYKFGMWVGECPKGFSLDVAQALLQDAIPEFRSTAAQRPYRLWTYYDGAIYVAYRSNGDTWHACPNGLPKEEPPASILKQLEERAKKAGEEARLKQWLRKRWDRKN